MNPLVSVVIACRNEGTRIAETIQSVLAQRWQHLEVIVVDDGSTDCTAAIVATFEDPRLRLIRLAPSGACAARNAGLRVARGDLIQMLDGDDLLAPEKIAVQVERWRTDGDTFVYFGPWTRFAHDPAYAVADPRPHWADMSGHRWLVDCWRDGAMMPPHAWLTPAALIRAAGPWNESLLQNQDGDFFSRVLLASGGVRFCPGALSHYRVGVKASISSRNDRAARRSRLDAVTMIADRLLAAPEADAETRAACATAFEELMFVTWVRYPDLAREARAAMRACGGTDHRMPYRGRLFRKTERLVGWRMACRLQHLLGIVTAGLSDRPSPSHANIRPLEPRSDTA